MPTPRLKLAASWWRSYGSFATASNIGLVFRHAVAQIRNGRGVLAAVLSVHHACIHTLGATPAFKILENQEGVAFLQMAQTVSVKGVRPQAEDQPTQGKKKASKKAR